MPKPKCKTCGASCEGEYCFRHKPRKPMLTTAKNYSNKLIIEEKSSMREMFLKIWKQRLHKSEISGERLGTEPLSIFFHHILPKEKYNQAALDEENIILMTLDEHSNVENDIYRYEEVNKRREYLKEKYDLT
jgi:hypothetical protein